MTNRRIGFTSLLVLLLAAGGCGSDRDSPDAAVPAAGAAENANSEIPLEEMYGASPVESLWHPRYEIEILDLPRGWNEARFAVLSDMRIGYWEGNEEIAAAAVRGAVEANPDGILLLGDFLARGGENARLREVLAPLRGRTAIAVLGSGDVRSDSVETVVTAALEEMGVRILRNNVVSLERNGDPLTIGGLHPDILERTFNDQQYVLAILGEGRPVSLLLMHAAPLASRAPTAGFPLIIGGNTFCGRVEVPGTPRLNWLHDEVFPNAALEGSERILRVRGSYLLVACGLGYGFVPLRFGSAPEVPIVSLVRVAAEAEEEADTAAIVEDTLLQRLEQESGASADTAEAQ